MKSVHRKLSAACRIFVLMLMAEISFAQIKNPTVYPYGGVPRTGQSDLAFAEKGRVVPLNFMKASFPNARFDSVACFAGAIFNCTANFEHSIFRSTADFRNARFKSIANFWNAYFDSVATFSGAYFDSVADFSNAQFSEYTDFTNARFDSLILERAWISGEFNVGVAPAVDDFRLLGDAILIFPIRKSVTALRRQKLDFTKTIFLPNAVLVLNGLIELNIQPEKFMYISFGDRLDYFLKKDIIENLKNKNFANDKSAQFELDYILAKSAMYQDPTGNYEENKWHEIRKWPKWFIRTIYYWTMGLGYRPFRLIYWVLVTIIIYTAIFAKKIPSRINAYISNPESNSTEGEKKKVHLSLWETLLNCAYFSVMLFFTFRLKRDILTFFDAKEKRLIVSEWVVGFLVYVAFLTLSKSGSIFYNLKELFIG